MKLELLEIEGAPSAAAPSAKVDDDVTVAPELVLAPGPGLTLAPDPKFAPDLALAPEPAFKDDATIELRPLERPASIASGPPTKIDVYAQQAAREYAQGQVDQALWDRALTQASGDKTAAAAIYVRARGTAIRLLDRDRRLDTTRPLPAPVAEVATERRRPARPSFVSRHRYPLAAAGVLVPAVVAGLFFLLAPDEVPPPRASAPAAAVAVAPTPGTPAVATPAAPAAAKVDAGGSLAALQAKIQALRDAGNWNVLVLYSVEWTRRQPDNPEAWNQLRAGYVYLRQYEDALASAKKAVELAPADPLLWRRLAEVYQDLDDPANALATFKEVVARDASDVPALQAMGMLATRLSQPQEAKAAFDRALAVQPGDPVTVCLRNAAAQLPPARDAYTAYRQVSGLDAKCRGRPDGASVAAR